MPDPTASVLARQIAEIVLDTPGVVRMEPPLTRALARLGRQGLQRRPEADEDRVDDVDLHLSDEHVDIAVDMIIAEGAQALATTRAVRTALIAAIEGAGHRPGRITVSVLGVDRG